MTPFDPTVPGAVRRRARATPREPALHDESRTVTYSALVERMNRVANATTGLGLPSGARVGLMAGNSARFLEILLGLTSAGLTPVLLNARSSARELVEACELTGTSTVLVDDRYADRLPSGHGFRRQVLTNRSFENWLARASAAPMTPRLTASQTFALPFTGGTTGSPKAVVLSQRSRTAMFRQMRRAFGCYSARDRNLTMSPLYHGAGFNFALATLCSGGSVTVLSAFDPELAARAMQQHGITHAAVVPTHLTGLLSLGGGRLRPASENLRALISNGAPLATTHKQAVTDAIGREVLYDAYGSTEAGIISYLRPEEQLQRAGSCGRLFPGTQLRVQDEAHQALPPGAAGAVATRSPYLFDGYWGETPRDPREWFSSGDLGHIDLDGYLYLEGRAGDKMITGGLNVFPQEVEDVLHGHLNVAEAAVFAVPDPYWGEAVHAAVVLHTASWVSEDELLAFAARSLAKYKVPKHVHVVTELPRSALGKVLRHELTQRHTTTTMTTSASRGQRGGDRL